MKRFMIVVCVWAMVLATMIDSRAKNEAAFIIYTDSNNTQTYEIKQKIQIIYSDMMDGLLNESRDVMLLHNVKQFAYKKDMQAIFKKQTLRIIEGDGLGDVIKGDLALDMSCTKQVEPRSFIKELFD